MAAGCSGTVTVAAAMKMGGLSTAYMEIVSGSRKPSNGTFSSMFLMINAMLGSGILAQVKDFTAIEHGVPRYKLSPCRDTH